MANLRTPAIFVILGISVICLYSQFHKLEDLKGTNDMVAEDVENVTRAVEFKPIISLLFQPNEAIEFPTVINGSPRIPHIFHQICDSETILDIFSDSMQSFVENNPTWEYRFWTYDSGRKFLAKYYSFLVDIYDGFNGNVKSSDVLRLALLHEYGGVYADLDVRNLRPLNITTVKYACIVPTEPFEHSAVGFGKEFVLSNALLMCRPGHPFFKHLLLNLQVSHDDPSPVSATGPGYLTRIYLLYNNISEEDIRKPKKHNSSNSPFFYKGLLPEDDNDAIYIPNSQYFMDNVDTAFMTGGELRACLNRPNDSIELLTRTCNEFEHRKTLREKRTFTFTFHFWFHMWIMSEGTLNTYKKRHVREIIPKCVFYQE